MIDVLILTVVAMMIVIVYVIVPHRSRVRQTQACDRTLTWARDLELVDEYDWDMVIWRRQFERWMKSGTRLPPPFTRPRPEDYEF